MYKEHPIPGFSRYTATECGEIISYVGKEPRILKQVPQKNARCRKQISLVDDSGEKKYLVAHRVIASAKLGRPLEVWEQVRHGKKGRTVNSMDNLSIGCCVLNMIDDIENGTRETNASYIDQAIVRLILLREQVA